MMFLLKAIRPKMIPNRKNDWDLRVRFFHWALIKLLPLYKSGAISDIFNADDIQVIHNVRDFWYEQELQRFNIETTPHLLKQSHPFNIKRKFRFSILFNWSESLLIFHNNSSYNIKRGDYFSIETDSEGQLKISTKKDFILRSEFILKATKPIVRQRESSSTSSASTSSRPGFSKTSRKPKIAIKDTMQTLLTDTSSSISTNSPQTIQYRGFVENDIF